MPHLPTPGTRSRTAALRAGVSDRRVKPPSRLSVPCVPVHECACVCLEHLGPIVFPTMESQITLELTRVCRIVPRLGFPTVPAMPPGPQPRQGDRHVVTGRRAALYSRPFVSPGFTKYKNRKQAPDSSDAGLRQSQPRQGRGGRRGGTQGEGERKENRPLKVKAVRIT